MLFSEEFLSFTLLELGLVKTFRYIPETSFSKEFLLHSSGYVCWGVSLTLLELGLVKCFRYTPNTSFSEEFLLHYSGSV